jgi:hypothetical protein
VTERDVQHDVVKLYRSLGCTVIVLSQTRPSHVSVGLPDLKVYCPRKRLTFWHEVKAPGGVQSTDQRTFQVLAEACGETYLLGGYDVAWEYCERIGLALAHA